MAGTMKKRENYAPDKVRLTYCPECRKGNIDLERVYDDLFQCQNCKASFTVFMKETKYDADGLIIQEDGYDIKRYDANAPFVSAEESGESPKTQFSIADWLEK